LTVYSLAMSHRELCTVNSCRKLKTRSRWCVEPGEGHTELLGHPACPPFIRVRCARFVQRDPPRTHHSAASGLRSDVPGERLSEWDASGLTDDGVSFLPSPTKGVFRSLVRRNLRNSPSVALDHGKLRMPGAVGVGLAVPLGVSSPESGSYTLRFDDACADDPFCTTRPNKFYGGANGKWDPASDWCAWEWTTICDAERD